MVSNLIKQFLVLLFLLMFSFDWARAACLNVDGKYLLKDESTGEQVILWVEQKECSQVNAVYDYGLNGKTARVMMLNGRPVVYIDTLEIGFYETYEIAEDRIKITGIETDKAKQVELITKSEIYLDENKNWIEEGKTYPKDQESEAKYYKLVYIRVN
jgi:hypothetical protein